MRSTHVERQADPYVQVMQQRRGTVLSWNLKQQWAQWLRASTVWELSMCEAKDGCDTQVAQDHPFEDRRVIARTWVHPTATEGPPNV